jgi:hypothetical protein
MEGRKSTIILTGSHANTMNAVRSMTARINWEVVQTEGDTHEDLTYAGSRPELGTDDNAGDLEPTRWSADR